MKKDHLDVREFKTHECLKKLSPKGENIQDFLLKYQVYCRQIAILSSMPQRSSDIPRAQPSRFSMLFLWVGPTTKSVMCDHLMSLCPWHMTGSRKQTEDVYRKIQMPNYTGLNLYNLAFYVSLNLCNLACYVSLNLWKAGRVGLGLWECQTTAAP